ncbi:hypothetical protein PMAYCL1PPCAC_25742, partial [Pristionchus mayeri]
LFQLALLSILALFYVSHATDQDYEYSERIMIPKQLLLKRGNGRRGACLNRLANKMGIPLREDYRTEIDRLLREIQEDW